jgi:hypothetical protein
MKILQNEITGTQTKLRTRTYKAVVEGFSPYVKALHHFSFSFSFFGETRSGIKNNFLLGCPGLGVFQKIEGFFKRISKVCLHGNGGYWVFITLYS